MSTYINKYAEQNGLTLVDSKKDLVVTVTQKDISKGVRKNPKCCAFSRAVRRENQKVGRAFVFMSSAYLEIGKQLVRVIVPQSVQKELVSYDRGGDMAPGEFTFKAPAGSQTLEAGRARSAKRPGRHQPGNTKIKRAVRHATTGVRTVQET